MGSEVGDGIKPSNPLPASIWLWSLVKHPWGVRREWRARGQGHEHIACSDFVSKGRSWSN